MVTPPWDTGAVLRPVWFLPSLPPPRPFVLFSTAITNVPALTNEPLACVNFGGQFGGRAGQTVGRTGSRTIKKTWSKPKTRSLLTRSDRKIIKEGKIRTNSTFQKNIQNHSLEGDSVGRFVARIQRNDCTDGTFVKINSGKRVASHGDLCPHGCQQACQNGKRRCGGKLHMGGAPSPHVLFVVGVAAFKARGAETPTQNGT